MESNGKDKVGRVLELYLKLEKGCVLNKAEEARRYGVNERSIQRDIENIRDFLERNEVRNGIVNSVVYDRMEKGYRMEQIHKVKMSSGEVLVICKILLASRVFTKVELESIIETLLSCCVDESQKREILDLIQNEKFHYVEPNHDKTFTEEMWKVGQAIRLNQYVQIEYKEKGKMQCQKVKPVGILFSESYFYLMAFDEKGKGVRSKTDVGIGGYPNTYRMDFIQRVDVLQEKFYIPYRNRFEEGEFRKQILFSEDEKNDRYKEDEKC